MDVLDGLGGSALAAPVLAVSFGDTGIELALGDVSERDTVRNRWVLPVGVHTLRTEELHADPPRPEELTNAIGRVVDHLDDVVREQPGVLHSGTAVALGPAVAALAAVEIGRHDPGELHGFVFERHAAEDVFRTLATEAAADRAHNPGLPPESVDVSVAASCAVVAVMRRLHLDRIVVSCVLDGTSR